MIEIPAWTTEASCAQGDPADFFPEGHGIGATYAARRAKMVCAECPVRTLCLTWQMDFEDGLGPRSRYGVWGGLTGEERARLAKKAAA